MHKNKNEKNENININKNKHNPGSVSRATDSSGARFAIFQLMHLCLFETKADVILNRKYPVTF